MGFSSDPFAATAAAAAPATTEPKPKTSAEPTMTDSSSPLSVNTHDDGDGDSTTSSRPDWSAAGKYTYTSIYPWLGPDYTNGNISFETQFQDWGIENPAIALQEALGEVWRKLVEGIHAELGALPTSMFMSMSRFSHGISSTNTTTTITTSSSTSESERSREIQRPETVCRCHTRPPDRPTE
ncbi:hypothetical protein ABEF95_013678 [Exophiala dermatitidis]